MQSTGPNANRASIICILESSLLEYGTSICPCWADNSIISRSNSILYTSYDALLLMQSTIFSLQMLKSKPSNIEPLIVPLALVRVHWLYPCRYLYERHEKLTTDANSCLNHHQLGFPAAETADRACSDVLILCNFVRLSVVWTETYSNYSQHSVVLLSERVRFCGGV